MVKTTMYTMATFSTLAFGNTSTKFIADYLQKDLSCVKSIVRSALWIVLLFSLSMCGLLFLFSEQIAIFVDEPQLARAFKFLGIIIVFRALNTLGAGILGGFKDFRRVGINNIIAGAVMFSLSITLARPFGLTGAYTALISSQVCLCILNLWFVYRYQKNIASYSTANLAKVLFVFSLPFAINELVYTATAWGSSMIMTKFASLGELGMYTACNQWNAIILFMPGLLGNVILSYLSTAASGDRQEHHALMKRMLFVNFVSTLVPMIIVMIFANYIARYYGDSFAGMESILRLCIFGTLFTCLTRVFDSNLMSSGKRWTAFIISNTFYITSFVAASILLYKTNGVNAAMNMMKLGVILSASALTTYVIEYSIRYKKATKVNQ